MRFAHDIGDYRDPVVKRLRALEIASVSRLSTGREGGVVMGSGAYGGLGWDGPTIDAWLGNFLVSDQGTNKLAKLARAKAAERHLVIVLDLSSQPAMGIYLSLTARRERGAPDYGIPSLDPPEPLTHMWLLPIMATREGLCWTRDRGWEVLSI